MLKAMVGAVVVLVFSANFVSAQSSLKDVKDSLDLIADYVDRMCEKIPLTTTRQNISLTAEGKADFSKFLKGLADLNVGSAGSFTEETLTAGVSQSDLATLLKNKHVCRKYWFDKIENRVFPTGPK